MSMILSQNKIEIYIPNSEASIESQHIGIKDRTVGAYYMSEASKGVEDFFRCKNGKIYVDLYRSFYNIEPLIDYIVDNDKAFKFKSEMMDQYMAMNNIKEIMARNNYIELPMPTMNDNRKYLRFENENKNVKLLKSILLGDLTKIVIHKLNINTFILYADLVNGCEFYIDTF